jgi:hypothetical protein
MSAPSKQEAYFWALALWNVWRDPQIRLDFDDDIEVFEVWAYEVAERLIVSAFVDL